MNNYHLGLRQHFVRTPYRLLRRGFLFLCLLFYFLLLFPSLSFLFPMPAIPLQRNDEPFRPGTSGIIPVSQMANRAVLFLWWPRGRVMTIHAMSYTPWSESNRVGRPQHVGACRSIYFRTHVNSLVHVHGSNKKNILYYTVATD